MSVLIKDIEKPKSCYAVIDGESEYCPFVNTDDDCVLQLKNGICEGTWKEQYSKCPLVEIPEPCEDAVSREWLISELRNRKVLFCKNQIEFKLLPEKDKARVDEIDAWIGEVLNAPSVTPKQRTGKWIVEKAPCDHLSDRYFCDQCKEESYEDTKCCPNCGAKMLNGGDQE